jgi:effector-binding domain-containing protein
MSVGPAQLRREPGTALAVIQRQVKPADLPRVVPECCGLVWNALRAQGARGGRHVALYWDGSIRLEVGVELLGHFVEGDGVVHSATPAGRAVSAAHFGPYGDLGAAHDAVRRWCAGNHQVLAGPSWELYGHWQPEWDHNPSLIRTDVFYQVVG